MEISTIVQVIVNLVSITILVGFFLVFLYEFFFRKHIDRYFVSLTVGGVISTHSLSISNYANYDNVWSLLLIGSQNIKDAQSKDISYGLYFDLLMDQVMIPIPASLITDEDCTDAVKLVKEIKCTLRDIVHSHSMDLNVKCSPTTMAKLFSKHNYSRGA